MAVVESGGSALCTVDSAGVLLGSQDRARWVAVNNDHHPHTAAAGRTLAWHRMVVVGNLAAG